ncbi:alpha-beta hydrolase superfamily lysophospholipase [Paraperlucidibaca baekdonensis]|uniref:Alpha-beta hydrolase superfamily lysophospholipase n=1 Tax=Paraperlucidibaca baekdonensis TaxID=748120 RepID=A0A3E0H9S5_9GAMM|nr:alpha/beta hydrolase [Paraperlucidibaca baekdonensis]REH40290.1 alpha-beta hydrolase superfamily lysophospholipase [Paraperlucidibaca baekdonensis]
MTRFSPEAARRALKPLNLDIRAPWPEALADYARFYGLDCLAAEAPAPTRHDIGTTEAWGFDIATQVFLPENTSRARGTLLVLHGYFDHAGLFTHPIRAGLTQGYAVVVVDLPGHGLSSGPPGEIDDFAHYQEMLRDLLAELTPQLPKPWVAVGQSTGGGILLDHVLSSLAVGKRPAFARVQLWAPLVRIAKWRQVTAAFSLFGRFKRSVPRHFKRSSHDDDFVDLIWHKDPFQLREVPLKWVGSMIRWETHMQSLPACRFPLTVVQGDADDTVDWRYNLRFIEQKTYVERVIEVHGGLHHLANDSEPYRQPALSALVRHVLI